jgi:Pyruvate/2-oxoacid:ferredoxin oxidoreductase gamma subunit
VNRPKLGEEETVDREIGLTGIGGQGIQLAAQTLAVAAVADGLDAQVFGSYGGMMRGGNSDSAIIIGEGRVTSPPTVSRYWGAIAMHPEYWNLLRRRLRPGSIVLIDSSVFRDFTKPEESTVVEVRATEITAALEAPRAASLCALGAFASATGIVSLHALLSAAESVLPSYRIEHLDANARAISAGFELIDGPVVPAWNVEVAAK